MREALIAAQNPRHLDLRDVQCPWLHHGVCFPLLARKMCRSLIRGCDIIRLLLRLLLLSLPAAETCYSAAATNPALERLHSIDRQIENAFLFRVFI